MRLAICGVGGQVAEGFIEQLAPNGLEFSSLHAFSVDAEDEQSIRVRGATVAVRALADADFAEFDILVVFETLPELKAVADRANDLGCHLIDASLSGEGAGRLVVPELMADERVDYPVFWSLPTAAVSALAPVLSGLLDGNVLTSISALVCEPASALGDKGTRRLAAETAKLLNGQALKDDSKNERLAFNLIPGACPDEAIQGKNLSDLLGLSLPDIRLERLQVPLFYGQTIQLTVGLQMPADLSKISAAWSGDSIHLVDNKRNFSPIALAEDDRIHIGRVRSSEAAPHSLGVWIIADNVRKSAVVNTIKLIEILIKSSI